MGNLVDLCGLQEKNHLKKINLLIKCTMPKSTGLGCSNALFKMGFVLGIQAHKL